jgi:hypothetical protein
MYQAFFDVDAAMEAMVNKGCGTGTQRATQVDTQTTPVDIREEPLFEDEIAHQTKGWSKRTGGYTELEELRLCQAWTEIGQDPIYGVQRKGGKF